MPNPIIALELAKILTQAEITVENISKATHNATMEAETRTSSCTGLPLIRVTTGILDTAPSQRMTSKKAAKFIAHKGMHK
mmetsp:Transcript_31700/g.70125  ORF Transcript_31700/g.70125 Transcript_31700/m.70125 type:complete len:80 (-) Transcript_31700:913-1152(-)